MYAVVAMFVCNVTQKSEHSYFCPDKMPGFPNGAAITNNKIRHLNFK